MIGYATDLQKDATLPSNDPADIFVERLPDVVLNQRDTVFGRKDDVVEKVGERRGHEHP